MASDQISQVTPLVASETEHAEIISLFVRSFQRTVTGGTKHAKGFTGRHLPSNNYFDEMGRLDLKGSGYLSKPALLKGLKKLGLSLTQQQLAAVLAYFELDGSGRVGIEEFYSVITAFAAQAKDVAVDAGLFETLAKPVAPVADAQTPDEQEHELVGRLLSQVVEQLHSRTDSVHPAFRELDVRGIGKLSKADMYRGLQSLGVRLPPRDLTRLVRYFESEHGDGIDYIEFTRALNEYRGAPDPPPQPVTQAASGRQGSAARQNDSSAEPAQQRSWQTDPGVRAALDLLVEDLSSQREGARGMFKRIDRKNSGQVLRSDLESALQRLGIQMKRGVLKRVMDALDINGDGHIDYMELMQMVDEHCALRLSERTQCDSVSERPWERDTVVRVALSQVVEQLHGRMDSVHPAFRELDVRGIGKLSKADMYRGLQSLGVRLPPRDLTRLITAFDVDDSGKVDIIEFCTVVKQRGGAQAGGSVGEDSSVTLQNAWQSDAAVHAALAVLLQVVCVRAHTRTIAGMHTTHADTHAAGVEYSTIAGEDIIRADGSEWNGQGVCMRACVRACVHVFVLLCQVSRSELEEALHKLGMQLTRGELKRVMNSFDVNGDGLIDYAELVEMVEGFATSAAASTVPAKHFLTEPPWERDAVVQAALSQMSVQMHGNTDSLLSTLRGLDAHGTGKLNKAEMYQGLELLGVRLPPRDVARLVDAFDDRGQVDIVEFASVLRSKAGPALQAAQPSRTAAAPQQRAAAVKPVVQPSRSSARRTVPEEEPPWERDAVVQAALSQMSVQLFHRMGSVLPTLRGLDAHGTGKLNQAEMYQGLELLGVRLPPRDLARLVGAFDDRGQVDIVEFASVLRSKVEAAAPRPFAAGQVGTGAHHHRGSLFNARGEMDLPTPRAMLESSSQSALTTCP
jgi:Ca2+-binding EF-hand superfamily protein